MVMSMAIDAVLNYDFKDQYQYYSTKHLEELGMFTEDIILNLGKEAGNLVSLLLNRIPPHRVDMLVSGPPCPPWAGQGKKGGLITHVLWSSSKFFNGHM